MRKRFVRGKAAGTEKLQALKVKSCDFHGEVGRSVGGVSPMTSVKSTPATVREEKFLAITN